MHIPAIRLWWLVPLILFVLSGPIVFSMLSGGENEEHPPVQSTTAKVEVLTQAPVQTPEDGDVLGHVAYGWKQMGLWWSKLPWYVEWPLTLLVLAIIGPPTVRLLWWVVVGVFRLSWGGGGDKYVPMRYTKQLQRARIRAKLLPLVFMMLLVVGASALMVYAAAPDGSIEWLARNWPNILLLGLLPALFVGIGVQFDKSIEVGDIPTFLCFGLAIISFGIGVWRAIISPSITALFG